MKLFLQSCLFLLIIATVNANAQPTTNDLVAYYPFNGNANDSSGYGNNGTVYGAVLTNDRFGNPNNAYLFNGSSSYIQVPSSPSLESNGTTNQITQTAWIYLNGENSGSTYPKGPITQKIASSSGQYMYRMYVNPNRTSAQGSLGQGYTHYNLGEQNSSYSFNLNEWYFVATTFNSSTGKIAKNFVNGVRIDSGILNINLIQNNYPLTIGKDPHEIPEYFNGIIDELRIYNRALSESEISVLHTASTLPLNLISFQAILKANVVELKWLTENELNTEKFVVQRATSNNNFKEIGVVKSNNKITNSYIYNDNSENIVEKTLFYRLKQVDKDGKFSYSKIVSVKVSNKTTAKIFPNPVMSKATIQLQSKYDETVALKIVSSDGKVLLTKTYNVIAGNNVILLNTLNLKSGVYVIVISGKNTNEHLDFSKQ